MAVLAALLVAGVVFWRQGSGELFWRVMAPVVRVRSSFGNSEVEQLRAALASTSAALADRNALYKENIDLKERLGRSSVEAPRVLAAVLQRPPWTSYDTLLIDAGSRQGIHLDDRVSAGGTALVGRITELHDTTARVELFSAPGQGYQALLNGTVPVAVEGQGAGSMRAELPTGTQVKVGDTVSFPGLAGGVVARVSAVDSKPGESYIVIYMHLAADPFNLSTVEVWKSQ